MLTFFKCPVSPKAFAIVGDAISSGVVTLLKGVSKLTNVPSLDPRMTLEGNASLPGKNKKCNCNTTVISKGIRH